MKRNLIPLALVLGTAVILAFWIRSLHREFSAPAQRGTFQGEPPLRLPEPEELGIVLPLEAFAPSETVPERLPQEEAPAPSLSSGEDSQEALPPPEELKRMEEEGIFSH